MTNEQEEALRRLLRGHFITVPAMVFGMLGGDPNDMTLDEQIAITEWIEELGYVPRKVGIVRHAHFMSVWAREEIWPGETPEDKQPYSGIPLRRDPELRLTREERAELRESRRRLWRYINDR